MSDVVYSHQFYDYAGDLIVTYILQSGFAGTTTEVTAGENPVTISWMGEGEEKFTHFKASEAQVELVSTTSLQYLSLFLATNKTYRVKVIRNGSQVWQGWINPEFYNEPFSPVPYVTTITATDGLALLKNVEFPIPADWKKSMIYYIATCLDQIGFPADEMNIYVVSDLSASTPADGVVTSRLLEKLFLDYRAMRDGNTIWSCYEVLENILITLNARLYQFRGAWWIERIDHKWDGASIDIYDMTGAYVSTNASYDMNFALTAHSGIGTDIRFLNGATLEVQPAYRDFTIKQDYGNRQNILKAASFDGKWTDTDFTDDTTLRYWDTTEGTLEALVEKHTLQNGEICLKMKPIPYSGQVPSFEAYITPKETGSPASRYVWTLSEDGTNEDAFMAWQYGLGVCYLKYQVFAKSEVYDDSMAPGLRSFVRIYINCSGTIYKLWSGIALSDDYTPSNYEWVETTAGTPTTYDFDHITVIPEKSQWTDVDVALRMPEAEVGNAQTYIGFLVHISCPNKAAADVAADDGLLYKNMQLYFVNGTENDRTNKEGVDSRPDDPEKQQDNYSRETTYTIDEDNLLSPEDYVFKYGDTPAPFASDGYGLVNKYVIFDSGGASVNQFGSMSLSPVQSMMTILRWDIETSYRRPVFKLRGVVVDTVGGQVGMHAIMQDYDSRYYFPTGLTYHVKQTQWEGEWVQCYDDSGTGEFNDDFNEDFWI